MSHRRPQLPRCKNWLKNACRDQYDDMNCRAASDFCYKQLAEPYFATGLSQFNPLSHWLTLPLCIGLNYYDITRPCLDPDSLCYPVITCIFPSLLCYSSTAERLHA